MPAIHAVNAMMCNALSHAAPSIGDLLDRRDADDALGSHQATFPAARPSFTDFDAGTQGWHGQAHGYSMAHPPSDFKWATSRATASGGVSCDTPWPKLKMNGRSPYSATIRSASPSRVASSASSAAGSRFPCRHRGGGSEERRGGEGGRYRWSPEYLKKKEL